MSRRRPAVAPAAPRIVTLLSDFGTSDGYVGIVKGVILGFAPDVRFVDLSHEIAPQNVAAGALVLESAVRFFPRGTIHLAIVDPGVGGERRAVGIDGGDFVLVGPDNGLLSLAAARAPRAHAYELDRRELHRGEVGNTFHGRDVFAPIVGRLAGGTALADCGRSLAELMLLPGAGARRRGAAIDAPVIYVDRFGNLMLDLRREDLSDFLPAEVSVTIRGVRIRGISSHYAAVAPRRPLLVWNSWDRLEIAVRDGSAARRLRARVGDRVRVRGDARR